MRSDPLSGQWFLTKPGNDVHVSVKDFLPTHSSTVPADVVSVWRKAVIHPLLDLLQQPKRREDLLLGQIEHSLAMLNRNDDSGMLESTLVAWALKKSYQGSSEDDSVLWVRQRTIYALHRGYYGAGVLPIPQRPYFVSQKIGHESPSARRSSTAATAISESRRCQQSQGSAITTWCRVQPVRSATNR
jgi:hypothetical protein